MICFLFRSPVLFLPCTSFVLYALVNHNKLLTFPVAYHTITFHSNDLSKFFPLFDFFSSFGTHIKHPFSTQVSNFLTLTPLWFTVLKTFWAYLHQISCRLYYHLFICLVPLTWNEFPKRQTLCLIHIYVMIHTIYSKAFLP